MRFHSSAAGLALAGLAVLGLTGPVAAGDQVPFKGSLEGVVTITPLTPPFVSVFVEATGNATHLGKFTLQIPHVVNRGASELRIVVNGEESNRVKLFLDGGVSGR